MGSASPRYSTQRTPGRATDGTLVAAASRLYAGGPLMAWQKHVADIAGERDPDTGLLVYDTVTLIVGRRAGKTRITHGVPLARGLMGPVTITRPTGAVATVPYLAASTAQNATQAIKRLAETYDTFREYAPPAITKSCRMLSGVNHAAIELNYRRREHGHYRRNPWASKLSVFPPTPHGVRGDKYLFLSIDEALTLTATDGAEIMQAARPTLSEFAGHAQLWIVSNEGQESAGFLRQRKESGRAAVLEGRNTGHAYFEWSMSPDDDPANPDVWRNVHPALGETLTESALARDLEELGLDAFAREYLNYSAPADVAGPPLAAVWESLAAATPDVLPAQRAYAFEVSYGRDTGVIVAAWVIPEGVQIAVVDQRPGTAWLAAEIEKLARHDKTATIVYDSLGPAAGLGRILEHRKLPKLSAAGSGDPRAACGAFIDLAIENRLRHDGDTELAASAAGALTRPSGDALYFDRRRSPVDVAPIVAASLAALAALRPAPVPFIL